MQSVSLTKTREKNEKKQKKLTNNKGGDGIIS